MNIGDKFMSFKGRIKICLREICLSLKASIRVFCVTSLFSFVLFFWKDVNFVQYLGVALSFFVFFVVSYCVFRSKKFFSTYGLIALTSLAIFLFEKCLKGYWFVYDAIDVVYLSYAACIVFFIFFALVGRLNYIKQILVLGNAYQDKVVNLFNERRFDLERILDYLRKYNTIGVVSKWGDGKTFLFKMLEQEINVPYYYVKIGVMSVTIDTVEKIILDEINHILESKGIFSSASIKLKNILSSQSILNAVSSLFFNSNSYASQIKILKEDVKKLNKPVVLVFEDIDRIGDNKIIYKIFSIAESLSSDRIKVVYQYNEADLINILEINKLYLEKYIPYTVNLTPIPFERVVAAFCGAKKYVNISKDDFMFLRMAQNIPDIIKNRVRIGSQIQLIFPCFSIRKITIFLDEIETSLNNDAYKGKDEIKNTLILYYFVKHFLYNLYDRITLQRNFLDEELFEYENRRYSLKTLLKANVSNNDFWSDQNNRQALCMLIMLGYEFKPIVDSLDENSVQGERGIKDFFKNVKEDEKNDKINRVIRNLYAHGLSEYTDYENAVKEMKRIVLNAPLDEQEEKYRVLSEKMYHQDFPRDNGTIFRIGIPGELELFRAFNIYEENSEVWVQLIDFYLRHKKIKSVTPGLIEVFLLCQIRSRKAYLHILKAFNALETIGNLNKVESYKDFLVKYLRALSRLGFVDTQILFWLEDSPVAKNEQITLVFDTIKEDLKKLQDSMPVDEMRADVDIIIDFIEKNRSIISQPNELQEPKYNGVNFAVTETSPHIEEIVEKLKNTSSEKVSKLIEELYGDERFSPAAIIEALDQWRKGE